jgi:4-amino-4-deoxy-L-arabinose transferase-like glycosyltransferase
MEVGTKNKSAWILLLVIILTSVTILLLINGFHPIFTIEADALTFYDATKNLYGGLPFSTFPSLPKYAHTAPGYPFFAYLTYLVAGGIAPQFTIDVQILLSPLVIICAFLIVRRYGGNRAGLLAAAFIAFLPNLVGYSLLFLSDQLSIVIYMLALGLLFWAFEGDSLWRFVWAGIAFGLLLYLKPVYQAPVCLVGLLLLLLWKKHFVKRIAAAVLLCGLMTLITVPWLVRNYNIFGRMTPMTIVYGEVMHSGNIWNLPDGYQRYRSIVMGEPETLRQQGRYAEAELLEEELLREDTLNYIKAHPGVFLSWTLARAVHIWELYPGSDRDTFGWYINVPFAIFYVILFLGVIICFFQKPPPLFFWVNIAFFVSLYLFQITNHWLMRYRLAFEPNLCLLSGYGWVALYYRWTTLRKRLVKPN